MVNPSHTAKRYEMQPMTTSEIDFELGSTKTTAATDAVTASSFKLQAACPRKNSAREWVQSAVEKLNRIRTDEAYRQEIPAKAK